MPRRITAILLLLCLWMLSGCNLMLESQIVPTATPDLPRVEVLAPGNNQQAILDTVFDFDVVARDEGAGISRVVLSIDGEVIHEATPVDAGAVPVFRATMNWRAQPVGQHLVEIIAYRPNGTASQPVYLNLEVLPRD